MSSPSETVLQRYRRRATTFQARVALVRPEQWDRASPCARWTVRDVVGHVVAMHGYMLAPLGRAAMTAPAVGVDAVAAIRAARADIESVLGDPRLAATICDTPTGRVTAEANIDGVLSDDLVLHGWDLARATGQDDTVDERDVPRLWDAANAVPAAVMDRFRTPGAFGPGVEVYGPEVPVPGTARLQDRLLGLVGRDPAWTPAAAAAR